MQPCPTLAHNGTPCLSHSSVRGGVHSRDTHVCDVASSNVGRVVLVRWAGDASMRQIVCNEACASEKQSSAELVPPFVDSCLHQSALLVHLTSPADGLWARCSFLHSHFLLRLSRVVTSSDARQSLTPKTHNCFVAAALHCTRRQKFQIAKARPPVAMATRATPAVRIRALPLSTHTQCTSTHSSDTFLLACFASHAHPLCTPLRDRTSTSVHAHITRRTHAHVTRTLTHPSPHLARWTAVMRSAEPAA
jgi:hypothetical protein